MKKNYLLLSVFLIAVFATLNVTKVNSKVNNPPAGSAGDPTFGTTCVGGGCHNGPDVTASLSTLAYLIGTGSVPTDTINLNSPTFKYTPGTLYHLTFKLNSFTGAYGFQTVALDASNAKAGIMATTAGTTQINTLSGLQYMGHKNANATKTWTFNWTAPASGTGPVSFYYAYNAANNDGDPTGDIIYKGVSTIQESTGSGIEDISSKLSDLTIFPNPISQNFGVSFDLKEANQVSAQLYSVDGQLVKELINEKTNNGHIIRHFDLQELQAGIYLVKINVGQASITKRIVKQ